MKKSLLYLTMWLFWTLFSIFGFMLEIHLSINLLEFPDFLGITPNFIGLFITGCSAILGIFQIWYYIGEKNEVEVKNAI